ncbi:MAG TPA: type VII secretion protein EccCb [Ktedonobacteraceae bacterium]
MHGTSFHRPARAYPRRLPADEVVVYAPPQLPPSDQGGAASLLQYLLPLVGSLGSLIFLFAYHSNPLLVAGAIGIALLSVGVGFLVRFQQERVIKRRQKAQREDYIEYLTRLRMHLREIARLQRLVRARLYPAPAKIASDLKQREHLWERRPEDEDFLHVRIGSGPVPLCSPVRLDLGSNPLVKYIPELRSQAEKLVADYSHLDDVPIFLSLRSIGTLAINGNRSITHGLVRALLSHIAAFHAPEDVRLIAAFPPDAAFEWSWLKWLPHTRRLRLVNLEKHTAAEPLCLLANSIADFDDLLKNQIKPEIERRRKLSEDRRDNIAQQMLPHLVFILSGFIPGGPLARLPLLDDLLRDATELGITIILLVDNQAQEPSMLQARMSVSPNGWLAFEEMVPGGSHLEGTADVLDVQSCEQFSRNLAPLTLAEKGAQQDFSQDIRLLDLLGFPSADDLQPAETWQARTGQALLRVHIGRRVDSEPLMLDLKEAAEKGMGVHGLVVGATGSGKSELLRTIVTSLAITHDPQTVNFVLVDWKGGASFADLAGLPHVAGVVTNLEGDLALIDRVYASLLGEQQRRLRMLSEAGNLDNIKEYQAKRKSYPAMEPLPYLLIAVDEFAQLIAHRPEFLELFVKFGQIGRSLGLYLLLATQRIDEGRLKGLEGHLRYRICLRTFSAAESTAVLGTPDAYYLPSTPGVGYFKVDTDIYSRFKTALISTPFVPVSKQVDLTTLMREFTLTGRLVPFQTQTATSVSWPVAPLAQTVEEELRTEMDVVISRLATMPSPRGQTRAHQVWLPPLEKQLTLDVVLSKLQRGVLDGSQWPVEPPFGPLCIPVGLVDKPLEQTQKPLFLDFSGANGHLALVGAPQSGKSTLLRTIAASFIATHSPRDVQLYCIDLGGGLLRVFEGTPHVGAVCGKTEREKIRRLVRQMRKVIEEREFLFHERGIESMVTYRSRRQAGDLSDLPFGDVFLIVDNLAQLLHDFDQLEAELTEIAMNGLTYGVHLILATNRWADIRSRLKENIGMRLEFYLYDRTESEFGKAAASALPAGIAGRGLIKTGLQFQAALPAVRSRADVQQLSLQQTLESLVKRAQNAWKGASAPPIRMLPQMVRLQDLPLSGTNQPPGVPVALEEFRLDPLYIDLVSGGPHFLIFGDAECGKTNALRAWMRGLEQRYTPEQVRFALGDYRRTLLEVVESQHLFAYACTAPMLKECVDRLKGELEGRMLSSSHISIENLRKPVKWSGPRYFLFVDDYDAVVTQAGNPLAPLVELLLHGRDIGFHLVLARRVGGSSRSFEPVMQRLKEMGSPGLIMSGDPGEGPLLHNQKAGNLPPGRGYLVRRNQPPTLVQVAYAEPDALPLSKS